MFGDDETIVGFRDLSVHLVYSPATLRLFYAEIHSDRLVQIGQSPNEDELVNKLKLAFPDGWTRDATAFRDTFDAELRDFTPPGERMLRYETAGRQYVVHRSVPGHDQNARDIHERVETMSMWYIDGATYCDLEDHRWVVYTVFEEHGGVEAAAAAAAATASSSSSSSPLAPACTYSFVGYMTTFNFTNPFRAGGLPAVAMRVCQLLIMPHAQRQGHGKRLLRLAHDEVARLDMYELTVEDPNEAFCRMRDAMDLRNCLAAGFFNFGDSAGANADARAAAATATATATAMPLGAQLDDVMVNRVRDHLRITRGQIRRCYEVLKLKALDAAAASITGQADSPGTAVDPAHAERSRRVREDTKAFRLEVKERLWNAHKAQLSKIEDKAQRLQALQMLWGEVAQGFRVCYANAFR